MSIPTILPFMTRRVLDVRQPVPDACNRALDYGDSIMSNTIALPSIAVRPPLDPMVSKGMLLGLSTAVIWAFYHVLSRQAVVHGLNSADLTFLRFATAGLIMLPLLLRAQRTAVGQPGLGGIPWFRVLALSLCAGPLFSIVAMSGYQFAPLAHGAAIQPAAITVFGMLLAAPLLGEKLTAQRIIGLTVVLAGLGILGGEGLMQQGSSQAYIGDLLFLAAGILWALFGILLRRWSVDAIQATAVVAVVSALTYVPYFILQIGFDRLIHAGFAAVALQAVSQGIMAGVVAVIAYAHTVKLLGAGRASLFPSLVPALAVLIAIPMLGEAPSAAQVGGLLVVSFGLATALGFIRRPAQMSEGRV